MASVCQHDTAHNYQLTTVGKSGNVVALFKAHLFPENHKQFFKKKVYKYFLTINIYYAFHLFVNTINYTYYVRFVNIDKLYLSSHCSYTL